jgi:putative transposase
MAYLDLNPVRAGMAQKPRDYPWSAHRELAAEDESTIRLHEVYLRLGPDRAARYRAYMQLLSQEAERPARSLATVLFVGTGDFVSRMRARFGLRGGAMPRVESHDFGDGAKALELRTSRKPAESTARS